MYKIPGEFAEFIGLDCDRQSFIQNFLNSHGIDAPVIPIEGNNHIYVNFPISHYNKSCKIKTVIAHYDRVPGTPGANDNSAAVFSMLNWAVRLKDMGNSGKPHNVRLIFSDGEEKGELGVTSQGAYTLAALFRKLKIINDDVFVFDCMGRGTIPILTETELPKGLSRDFINDFAAMEKRAQQIIKSACGNKWCTLPCNYSDNAGFIANGIPAVAITLLPSSEVSEALNGITPKTWLLNHSIEDNLQSVDSVSFEITTKILDKLACFMTFI